ncbi:hypothetical protein [Streptomyces lycii]|uniref:Secreted protein n=1 Tax=Streptomyces lycii TaxID=2654337 RepID=A0ABQ7FBV2_9ACTN|nr:hypothetical protein [Streptomyces lycii]KAF4406105.1 hypothetical protein GCU69_26755 [Streptomyces lycii]
MRRIARMLVSSVALAGVSAFVTAGTAAAADTAYNTRTQYLVAHPDPGLPESCFERRIQLAAGDYHWYQVLGSAYREDFRLGAGWYTWRDCLEPRDNEYYHETTLDPDHGDWVSVSISSEPRVGSTGDVLWGSKLVPQF